MDNEKIKQLEIIVHAIYEARSWELIDNEPLIQKIREITGNGLDAFDSESIYYDCTHGMLSFSLEETVYYLMHGGKYRKKHYSQFYLWKKCGKTNFTDEDIYVAYEYRHKFDKAKVIVNKLATFPLHELFSFIENQFPDWIKEKYDNSKSKYCEGYSFEPKKPKEYAMEESIYVRIYDQQVIRVQLTNIDNSIENSMVEHLLSLGNTVYYRDGIPYPSRDYAFPSE